MTDSGWLIVADDLTGAADALAPFASPAAPRSVWLGPPAPHDSIQSWCVPIRHEPHQSVVERIAGAVAQSGHHPRLLLKVDSAGRSPIGAIIDGLLRARPGAIPVVCPALPSQGRTVAAGTIETPSGPAVIDVPDGVRVFDAADERDLDRLADEVIADRSLVPIASSGLCRALARAHGHRAGRPPSPHRDALVVVGTRHPVTVSQLAALDDGTPLWRTPEQQEPGALGDLVQRVLGAVQPTSALVVMGGDTALALLTAAGAAGLDITGEVEPGVPCGTVRAGVLDGLPITLKSGGFGGRGTLAAMVAWASGSAG